MADKVFEIVASFTLPGSDQLAHADLVSKITPAVTKLKEAAKEAGIELKIETRSFTPQVKKPRKAKAAVDAGQAPTAGSAAPGQAATKQPNSEHVNRGARL